MVSKQHIGASFLAAGFLSLAACQAMEDRAMPRRAAVGGQEGLVKALLAGVSHGSADLSLVASREGKLAVSLDQPDAVLSEVAGGHAVVVGHGAHVDGLVSGYDMASNSLVVVDGALADHRLDLAAWRREWSADQVWSVLVLQPGQLPVQPETSSYGQAAERLERDGSAWEAVLAFDAGVARWPDNAAMRAGLAESLYRLGALREAAEAFTAAVNLSADAAERQRILRRVSALVRN